MAPKIPTSTTAARRVVIPQLATDSEEDLVRAVQIDEDDIKGEYIRLPGELARWNTRYADAVRAMAQAEAKLERLEAEAFLLHKTTSEKLDAAEAKKYTVDRINALVRTDAAVCAAGDVLIEAQANKAWIAGVVDAIRAKREMLVSLGAHLRAEMEMDPAIRNRS